MGSRHTRCLDNGLCGRLGNGFDRRVGNYRAPTRKTVRIIKKLAARAECPLGLIIDRQIERCCIIGSYPDTLCSLKLPHLAGARQPLACNFSINGDTQPCALKDLDRHDDTGPGERRRRITSYGGFGGRSNSIIR